MPKFYFTFILTVIFSIILFSGVHLANAQDIAQLMAEKYTLQVDEQIFEIYYGFKGSLEVEISSDEAENPLVSQMNLKQEEKSIEIIFEESEYAGPMWVRLPTELITAEGGKFQLLIDDDDKPLELTYYANDISVGFFFPEGTLKVEIIGTRVVPEFSAIAMLVLGIGMMSLIILTRKINSILD